MEFSAVFVCDNNSRVYVDTPALKTGMVMNVLVYLPDGYYHQKIFRVSISHGKPLKRGFQSMSNFIQEIGMFRTASIFVGGNKQWKWSALHRLRVFYYEVMHSVFIHKYWSDRNGYCMYLVNI